MLEENKDDNLKKITSIHTLESDLASAVMDNDYGRNIIKIVTDPNQKNKNNDVVGRENNIFNIKNIFIFFIIISIISIIILSLLYKDNIINIIKKNQNLATTTESIYTESQPIIRYIDILKPEIVHYSDFTKLGRGEIVLEIDKIKNILLEKKIESNNNIGINSNLTVRQFFEKIRYSGDDSLLRSFSDTYGFGLYLNEKKQFENYLLIEINDFDLAFSSILNWEKYMPVDLKDIFIGNNEIIDKTKISTNTNVDSKNLIASTSSSTVNQILTSNTDSNATLNSTSTSNILEKKYYKKDTKVFVDNILKNYDTRVYIDNSNNMTIVYGFINNKFLLITSGESSFIDIKNRLLKENILR